MSIFDKRFRLTKIFYCLGILSIPLFSAPLLLPLIWAQSLPSSPPSVPPSVNLSTPPSSKQSNKDATAASQRHQQLVSQNPVTTNSSIAKTHNSNSRSQTPKPSVKPQKQAVAAKPRTPKSTAKPHYTAPAVEIRVAIAKDIPSVAIGASTEAQINDANGKFIQKLPPAQSFLAQPNGSALVLKDWQLPPVVWIQPKKGGYVYVGDRWYRGRILLVSQGSSLLAVNYVDLEQYLYSVVGSEMHPNAPLEALKAQAIAARSYALVHRVRPASAWYNLGANERWQVYKGLHREYNTTHQAVNETAGQILSYQGGLVESLYAASGEIVVKAHGGVGMSQTGAYKLAEQGYDYRQILGAYYPDTELAKLELKR